MKIQFLVVIAIAMLGCPLLAQETPTASKTSTPKLETSNDNEIVIELTKSRRITGELSNVNEVVLQTKFGEAKIPLNEVDGIKLHTDENDAAVVAFKNGDVVTGTLAMDSLSVVTDWGDANVKLASVETILLNKAGSFYEDSSDGKRRWRFGDTREMAADAARARQQPQRPGFQPQRSSVQQSGRGGGFGG